MVSEQYTLIMGSVIIKCPLKNLLKLHVEKLHMNGKVKFYVI